MASKRRLRRKACESKVTHATNAAARAAAREMRRRRPSSGWIEPYACPFCGRWHIGHPPVAKRQSMAAKARSKGGRLLGITP